LVLKDDSSVENLISELYYRNIANHAYADIDSNKIAPVEKEYTVLIDEGSINNIDKLDYLSKKYGINCPIGTKINNKVTVLGIIDDLYTQCTFTPVFEDENINSWRDPNAVFKNYSLGDLYLLKSNGIIV
jgi:hypothetical protein